MLVVRCELNEIIDFISAEMKEYNILARINGAFLRGGGSSHDQSRTYVSIYSII